MGAASESIEFALPTRRATRRLGAALGALLAPGDLVVLEGELGAGKTFLVRGIARALGVPAEVPVTSPTFALVHELPARVPLLHADLYRLGDADEVDALGLVERVGHDAVALVEWGERFLPQLRADGLLVRMAHDVAVGRRIRLTPLGPRGAALIAALERGRGAWEARRPEHVT
jgi:tRNA threonylcarbamoyladenosine biosynthesis protein TsaE